MELNYQNFLAIYQKVPVEIFPNNVPDNPLISISVPTYQHKDMIAKCLDGILMQKTRYSFEILLGEDASTDGTRETCIAYAQKYPDKIKLFLHSRDNNIKISGKPTGRFNALYNIYNSKGKYLALCEGDDYWTDSTKLEKQVSFLEENPKYVLTYHRWINYEFNSNPPIFHKESESHQTLTLCFRNVIKSFPIEVNESTNFDVFLKYLLREHGDFKFIKDIEPAVRTLHSGGIWSPLKALDRLPLRLKTDELLLKIFMGKPLEQSLRVKILRLKMRIEVEKMKKQNIKGKLKSALKIVKLTTIENKPVVTYHALRIFRNEVKQKYDF